MGRPSKLSPPQWAEVERRSAEGEGARALAKEFGVDEAAIRRRVNPQNPQVRKVAAKLAEAQAELATLPVAHQYIAQSLADKLRNISTSMAAAAELGAKTAHRMHALANNEAGKVDDADPLKNREALQGVAVLLKLGNEAAVMPTALLNGSKDAVSKANGADQPPPPPTVQRLSLADWKKAHGLA